MKRSGLVLSRRMLLKHAAALFGMTIGWRLAAHRREAVVSAQGVERPYGTGAYGAGTYGPPPNVYLPIITR